MEIRHTNEHPPLVAFLDSVELSPALTSPSWMLRNTSKADLIVQALSLSDAPVKKSPPRVPDVILRAYCGVTNKMRILVCTFTGHDLDSLEVANGKERRTTRQQNHFRSPTP